MDVFIIGGEITSLRSLSIEEITTILTVRKSPVAEILFEV